MNAPDVKPFYPIQELTHDAVTSLMMNSGVTSDERDFLVASKIGSGRNTVQFRGSAQLEKLLERVGAREWWREQK